MSFSSGVVEARSPKYAVEEAAMVLSIAKIAYHFSKNIKKNVVAAMEGMTAWRRHSLLEGNLDFGLDRDTLARRLDQRRVDRMVDQDEILAIHF